jgi:hypothetical protein
LAYPRPVISDADPELRRSVDQFIARELAFVPFFFATMLIAP